MRDSLLHIVLLFFAVCLSSVTLAQGDYEEEISRCFRLFQDAEYVDNAEAKIYADSGLYYALKGGNPQFLGQAHQFMGWHHQDMSAFKEARSEFYLSLESFIKAGDKQGVADAYGNLGNAYFDMDLYKKSLEYQIKSLEQNERILVEVIGKKARERALEGKTYALHNIASIYSDIGLHEKGLEYELQSLSAEILSKNLMGEAISCNAIAISYKALDEIDSSTLYFERALKIHEKINYPAGMASVLYSYGVLNGSKLSKERRKEMIVESLRIHQETGDIHSYIHQLLSIANENFETIPSDSVSWTLKEAKREIRDHDLQHLLMKYEELNARHLAKTGHHKEAYAALQRYLGLKIISDEEKRSNDILVGEVTHDFTMKSFNDSLALSESYHLKSAIDEKKIADQRSWITLGVLGGLILIASLFFFVNSNRRKRRLNEVLSDKNAVIKEQKDLADEHYQSVSASIQYAKRLQFAILPTRDEVNIHLPESFLFFRPKDVVSGDFYWFEVIDDVIYIAVADCTGHGVPGAMVSVVCSNALHRVLNELQITSPAEILTRTRELVIETFGRSDEHVEDGMDISLCAIYRKEKYIEFAGANNPLWIVRSNAQMREHKADRIMDGKDYTLLEYKADKQPVGPYPVMKDFTQKRISLESDDMIYLFSDGFVDQFGGVDGKKFKSAHLKEEILSMSNQDMSDQSSILAELFTDWKGELDQVDDVCIVGFKLS
ncbi:MAG: serine phosphatase RsbU (regulator of sigma subunit) [Crocinitomicaceae bacterium]